MITLLVKYEKGDVTEQNGCNQSPNPYGMDITTGPGRGYSLPKITNWFDTMC